jgi:hypothetical protein
MSILDITAHGRADVPVHDPVSHQGLGDWEVAEITETATVSTSSGASASDAARDQSATVGSPAEGTPLGQDRLPEPSVPGTRPTFTITEAAGACAVSRKTVTRKLGDLAEYGAAKDEDGVWRIPVEALLAVGLHPGRSLRPATQLAPRPASPVPPPAQEPRPPSLASPRSVAEADIVTVPRERWDDLRLRLARAEAEAAERALALADARLALRALTAGPAPPRPVDQAPPASASDEGSSVRHGRGGSPVVPGAPPAVGWVMGSGPADMRYPDPPSYPGSSVPANERSLADPQIVVLPDPPRKRRWWRSSTP